MRSAASISSAVRRLFGGSHRRALNARDRGRYFAAFQIWRRLAATGHAHAAFEIGQLYQHGHGVVRDPIEAAAWYRRAAECGHAAAQLRLGAILLNGARAILPEDMRDPAGHPDVPVLFPNGVTLEAAPAEGIALLTSAAEKGETEACTILGAVHLDGSRVERDFDKARAWFEKAAAAGDASAEFGLGDIHFNGLGVAVDQSVAAGWYEKAAGRGHARAQLAIGYILQTGQGREPDLEAAGRWIESAAGKGDPAALRTAAKMHISGEGLPKNVDRAVTYTRFTSEPENPSD